MTSNEKEEAARSSAQKEHAGAQRQARGEKGPSAWRLSPRRASGATCVARRRQSARRCKLASSGKNGVKTEAKALSLQSSGKRGARRRLRSCLRHPGGDAALRAPMSSHDVPAFTSASLWESFQSLQHVAAGVVAAGGSQKRAIFVVYDEVMSTSCNINPGKSFILDGNAMIVLHVFHSRQTIIHANASDTMISIGAFSRSGDC